MSPPGGNHPPFMPIWIDPVEDDDPIDCDRCGVTVAPDQPLAFLPGPEAEFLCAACGDKVEAELASTTEQ